MLGKSMKAIVVVVMMGLLLVPASLGAAADQGTGAMTRLDPGGQHWYSLTYQGSQAVQVGMNTDPGGAAAFLIATQDGVDGWGASGDPASGTSPLDGPEFYVAKYGTGAQPDGDPASATSPLDGPEFYVGRYGAEPAGCVIWSDALARFHRVKPLSDPANGAWSLAQAQFFVAQYGTGGALTIVHGENDQLFLC